MTLLDNIASTLFKVVRYGDPDRFDRVILSQIPKPFTPASIAALPSVLTNEEKRRLIAKMQADPTWTAGNTPARPFRRKRYVRSRKALPAQPLQLAPSKKRRRGASHKGKRMTKTDDLLQLYDQYRAEGANIERAKLATTAETHKQQMAREQKQKKGSRGVNPTKRKRSNVKVRSLKDIRRSVDRAVKKYRHE